MEIIKTGITCKYSVLLHKLMVNLSIYGNVDFLDIKYRGYQVYKVVDGAPVVTQNGIMDFPGGVKSNIFTYNDFGALTSDSSCGISGITYDNFGNPTKIQYSGNLSTSNVYSATGERLKTVHYSGLATLNEAAYLFDEGTYSVHADDMNIVGISGRSTVEYHGSVIYRAGKVDMVLFPGGYATIDETLVTFHYYTQDYLGNNRAVINGSTGAIEQTVAYYPYGAVIADLGTNQTSGQPYKFGGKELITANGLNEYDFGARLYYPAVPGFTKPDPLCEDTRHLSPYLFCGNDPVNKVDPSGMVVIGLDEQSQQNIIYTLTDEEAKFVRFDESGAIDASLLNKSSSSSDNMTALKAVVNSNTTYYITTANSYNIDGINIDLHESSDLGVVGTTLIPGAESEPSPDDNVHIFTSIRLSQEGMVENTAHELYGHGYFFELQKQGVDVNPFHTKTIVDNYLEYDEEYQMYIPVLTADKVNDLLERQIQNVSRQAVYNYRKRKL